MGLGGVTALSLVLNLVKLSQNGYANIYYSGAVKSMLRSWHAFFFVSADQLKPYVGNLIVGTELKFQLWVVRPHGNGFQTRLLKTDVPPASYNLEGAAYIPGP